MKLGDGYPGTHYTVLCSYIFGISFNKIMFKVLKIFLSFFLKLLKGFFIFFNFLKLIN